MQKVENLIADCSEVFKICEKSSKRWFIFGGVAAFLWGSPRSVTDLDLWVESEITASKVRLLSENLHLPVDVFTSAIWLKSETVKYEIDSQSLETVGLFNISGHDIQVMSKEDILLMKLISFRGPLKNKFDDKDIAAITLKHDGIIRWSYIKHKAVELDVWSEVVDNLKSIRSLSSFSGLVT